MKLLLLLGVTLLAAIDNPASFMCEQHNQSFIKQGSEFPGGKCYDVYTHASPKHKVLVPCKP